MGEWWNAIPTFEKVFWFLALPTSVIMILQLILSFFGIGHEDSDLSGMDHDIPVDQPDISGIEQEMPVDQHESFATESATAAHEELSLADFKLFSIRNILVLIACMGWAGIAALRFSFPKIIVILYAIFVGFLVMVLVAGMFYLATKMKSSGTMDIRNAVNSVGSVYLPIPAEKQGTGVVQVSIQGAIRELQAMTLGEALPTGTKIKVIALINKKTLLVVKDQT